MRTAALIVSVCISFVSAAQRQPIRSDVYRWKELNVEKEQTRERRQVLEGSARDLALLEIHTSTLEPGRSPHSAHTHTDVEELVIVKEGRLKVTIKDQSKILGPGSVALAIPGEEHGFENGGDTKVTYYIIKYRSKLPMDPGRGKQAGGSFMLDRSDLAEKTTDKGSRVNYFERATCMAERFEMHVTTLNAGMNSHAPHTHRAEEIVLMIRGSGSIQIGEQHKDASAGDLIFLGSDVPHAFTNTGKEPCSYFAFQWN
jgi:(S)-ureidoglycine aminohydrolase